MRFTVLEDHAAILYVKGVWRQAQLYERAGYIYAKHGSGFIRLHREGRTSLPNIRWEETDLGPIDYDHHGRMTQFPTGLARPAIASVGGKSSGVIGHG